MGKFWIEIEGDVLCERMTIGRRSYDWVFRGEMQLGDIYNFDPSWFDGSRSTSGELFTVAMQYLANGEQFRVRSDWIPIFQRLRIDVLAEY